MKKIILALLVIFFIISCSNKTIVEGIENVSVKEFNHNYNPQEHQLLDVRTDKEFQEGTIPNAINIDVLDEKNFKKNIKELDKNKPIYVFCKSGKRSVKASKILKSNGFKDIRNLEGGIKAWEKLKDSID